MHYSSLSASLWLFMLSSALTFISAELLMINNSNTEFESIETPTTRCSKPLPHHIRNAGHGQYMLQAVLTDQLSLLLAGHHVEFREHNCKPKVCDWLPGVMGQETSIVSLPWGSIQPGKNYEACVINSKDNFELELSVQFKAERH